MENYKQFRELKNKYPEHLFVIFSETMQKYVLLGTHGKIAKSILGTNKINKELSQDIWLTELKKSGYGVIILEKI